MNIIKKATYTENCDDLIWGGLFDGVKRSEEKLEEFYKLNGVNEAKYSKESKEQLTYRLQDLSNNQQALAIWTRMDREAEKIEIPDLEDMEEGAE